MEEAKNVVVGLLSVALFILIAPDLHDAIFVQA